MDEELCYEIIRDMDEGVAIFRIVLDETHRITDAYIEDCNNEYLNVSEYYGWKRDDILHHSYYEMAPAHDPRWDYYVYQAAVLRKHIHGGFKNREFGSYMEFSGGPAHEPLTCWIMFVDHTKFQNENEKLLRERNIDQLTGVKNRNAYEDVLKQYEVMDEPIGILMADLNGLKETNDQQGHVAGDRMIEKAASFLCTLTNEDLPYRIGGDEFVLLFKNITAEELQKKVKQVYDYSDVSISCGSAWSGNAAEIRQIITKADEEMYEQKKRYYRSHERRHVK